MGVYDVRNGSYESIGVAGKKPISAAPYQLFASLLAASLFTSCEIAVKWPRARGGKFLNLAAGFTVGIGGGE